MDMLIVILGLAITVLLATISVKVYALRANRLIELGKANELYLVLAPAEEIEARIDKFLHKTRYRMDQYVKTQGTDRFFLEILVREDLLGTATVDDLPRKYKKYVESMDLDRFNLIVHLDSILMLLEADPNFTYERKLERLSSVYSKHHYSFPDLVED